MLTTNSVHGARTVERADHGNSQRSGHVAWHALADQALVAFRAGEHCFRRMGQCAHLADCPGRALITPFLKSHGGRLAQCHNRPGCVSGNVVHCAERYLERADAEARVCANVSNFVTAVNRLPRAIKTCPHGADCPGAAASEVLEHQKVALSAVTATV